MLSRSLMTACCKIDCKLTSNVAKTLVTQLIGGLQRRCSASESKPLLARAKFVDPRCMKNGFVTDAGCNQVNNDVTAAVSRHI